MAPRNSFKPAFGRFALAAGSGSFGVPDGGNVFDYGIPAVTGLVATPDNGQVLLEWDVGGGGVANYWVYRSLSNSPLRATRIAVVDAASQSFLASGLLNGTLYYFWVAAFNGGLPGDPGVGVSATPATVGIPPTGLVLLIDERSGAEGSNSTLVDQSAAGNDATQADTSKQPTGVVITNNGLSFLGYAFDDMDDGMVTPLTLGQTWTMFLVQQSLGVGSRTVCSVENNAIICPNRVANSYFNAGIFAVDVNFDYCLVQVTCSPAGINAKINGVDITTDPTKTNAWGTVALGTSGFGSETANANVFAVAVYNDVDAARDTAAAAFLADKYAAWLP